MKQYIIYYNESRKSGYITSRKNYEAYVSNVREYHRFNDVSLDDIIAVFDRYYTGCEIYQIIVS